MGQRLIHRGLTTAEAVDLLLDWMIIPNQRNVEMVKTFFRLGSCFNRGSIIRELDNRDISINNRQLVDRLRPFLHRRLLVRIPYFLGKGQQVFRLAPPRHDDASYARRFKQRQRRE